MPKEPPSEPILRLNTEMHTAPIGRIGVDSENKYLVTGSEDKTIKVWDIRDLSSIRLLQTLRVPIGEGKEGKIYAVAISPDGETIASGGWTGYEWDKSASIYIFDRQSGKLIKRITWLPNVIQHLSYSKDGRFLAATLGGANGIRIYETDGYSQVASDTDYGDSSYGADFDKEGRLVTSSDDGYIRLYDREFKLIKKEKPQGGSLPFSVAFSPNGSNIAVGIIGKNKVEILSGSDLSYQYSPDTSDANGDFSIVSFSLDGNYLYAGGKASVNGQCFIRKWSNGGKGQYKDLSASVSTIMQIVPLKNDGIVFGSQDPAFGIFDKKDERIVFKQGDKPDYRGNTEEFQISKDTKTIRFWYEQGGNSPKVFSLKDRELLDVSNFKDNLLKPILKSDKLDVTDWLNNYNPQLNERALQLKQHERSRSLAILPDDSGFLLASEWALRLFDKNGKEKWNIAVPSVAWNVNVSQNGKIAVAAFADGTIRWFRVRDGKELLAFFPLNDKDRNKWVLWTPTGYYDASVGGDELIGWHVNRGKDKEADFYSISKFSHIYYRPDIVSKVLDTLDEDEAIRQANEEANLKTQTASVTKTLPPVVKILSPVSGAEAANTELVIKYEVRTPADAPLTAFKVIVNGVKQEIKTSFNYKGIESNEDEIAVKIPEEDCTIALVAENKHSASEPAIVVIKWKGTSKGTAKSASSIPQKPRLFILSVGINDYQSPAIRNLSFAEKDAKDFVKVMREQEDILYKEVIAHRIPNEEATKENILDGFDWLDKSKINDEDVVMVLLSGHGTNDPIKNFYYYISADTDINRLKATAVPFTDIKNTVTTLRCKTVFFLDTCRAGNVTGAEKSGTSFSLSGILNDLMSAQNGVIVFASSTGTQVSLEHSDWENGAFTKAVVEGIKGEADFKKTGRVTINMMNLHISERVRDLTDGKQTPVAAIPITVPDFPIAVV
ncbi:MAG: caspase family protein [Nitrospirae bacterium]|nr:caspase family protein [Nitrospirota bacterium]MBF0534100.1 caspase family protein [Nitrospirota bacterium]MBF0616987.1 caspase family protein [Nitrospirota bacterium]